MTKPKAFVAEWKKKEVKELENTLSKFQIIGIADLTSVPSLALQKMKEKLKPGTVIKMARINLLKVVFENLKTKYPNIENLTPDMRGMVSLVITNDNPFALMKTLNASKTPAPAKAGQFAPRDIKIPAGPTPFAPGPIIGELGKLGIKTGVEAGKVAVKEDTVVVKKGETISKDVATVLTRLQINPMEIGINLMKAWEKGTIYDSELLSIDEKAFKAKLNNAITDAFKLAYSVKYPTKETLELFIREAQIDACKLADSENIITDGNVARVLGKIEASAQALKSSLNL
jgi:large subunit ribosomal protein L10